MGLLAVALVAAALLSRSVWVGLAGSRTNTLCPITHGDGASSQVALTFDVDSGEVQTRAIVAALRAAEAPATFFLTERWAKEHADLVREMAGDGFALEASGRDYADMSRSSRTQTRNTLSRVSDAIFAAAGRRPGYFRPPAGKYSDATLEGAIDCSLVPITWTLDSEDWRAPDSEAVVQRSMAGATPGAIILLHADDSCDRTAPAIGELVRRLRERRIEPVLLDALLSENEGAPARCSQSGATP